MLPLDSFYLRDYASWKLEHHTFLEGIRNCKEVYERIEPIYIVLNHLYGKATNNEEFDDDLETIFRFGFEHLNNHVAVLKIYYDTLFQGNIEEMRKYGEPLAYLMYIYELRIDLEQHGFDSNLKELNDIENLIENSIMERRDEIHQLRVKLNEALKKVFSQIDYEYSSITDIYVEIAENLDIYLYEEDDFLIGKDI
jgi:ElaB/YqjD/DUF883 family membrane-anchored ribosome-binding protein